jgi:pilus assembly protein CpaB
MNRRLALVLVCAALVGVVAAFLVYRLVLQMSTGTPVETTDQIVVAKVNIPLGDTLTAEHVKLVAYPRSSVPADAVRSVEILQGRTARATIVTNEPVLESKLGPAGKTGIMPLLVPEGQRAVTINLDQATRESGFLLPNSRVDVLVSMEKPVTRERIAKLVLQDVSVLAAGQVVETRDNRPVTVTTVTLALTPDQTERLTLAQTEGRIVLATRNLRDTQVVQTRGVTPTQLLSDGGQTAPRPEPVAQTKTSAARPAPKKTVAAEPLPAPKVESVSITVIRGSAVTEQRFGRVSEQPWQEQREPNK